MPLPIVSATKPVPICASTPIILSTGIRGAPKRSSGRVQLDRPIFLSIGYSACHWCHVMEQESFEDPAVVAHILNDHFISIKVDREERPDLDQIYMTAVQLLTKQGGWPMSVFLTPDLQTLLRRHLFPAATIAMAGRASKRLLGTRGCLANSPRRGRRAAAQYHRTFAILAAACDSGARRRSMPRSAGQAVAALAEPSTTVHGGFGSAPKFPHAMELRVAAAALAAIRR